MIAIFAATVLLSQSDTNPVHAAGPRIEVRVDKRGAFIITTAPKTSPKTVEHILDLVKRKFYDGIRVHRVEYWVTQWGDPQSRKLPMSDPKMGYGDTGYRLPFEMSDADFVRGTVGIASDGLQNGGDCQLFVIKQDRIYLYRSYAIVGMVTSGMDVVDKIKIGDRILSARALPNK